MKNLFKENIKDNKFQLGLWSNLGSEIAADTIGGAGFDHVIVETVGAGQNDVAIRTHVDETVVVLVPGMGDAVQMEKAGILEIADIFVVNKADYDGESALVRELLDIANGRTILETIATQGKGVVELLDRLF